MPSLSRRFVCLGVIVCLLLAYGSSGLSWQMTGEGKQKFNRDIRCVIQTERRQWNRDTETFVSGTIVNLTDGPLELEAGPALYLSSRTSSEIGDKICAPVDLLRDSPIGIDKRYNRVGVGIGPRPIHLQFKNRNDKIDFRIDAQHLFWAEEISSGWPPSALFGTAKADDHDLQLVLETDNGGVESLKVKSSIDASKPPKQEVQPKGFPTR